MKKIEDQILVIFGASGDLAKRELIPSLFGLYLQERLPEKFAILGASHSRFTDKAFRDRMRENIEEFRKDKDYKPSQLTGFLKLLYYVSLDFTDPAEFPKLGKRLGELEKKVGSSDRVLYYFSTPPDMFEPIADGLGAAKLNKSAGRGGWRRVIVEKPFGSDLESARRLDDHLSRIFHENEIYRIDHFLGKETVQNILVLRFSNGVFEPLWNRNYIDYVEINVSETLGMENRGRYYEGAGAVRDMIQNHLMQLMAYVAMESPAVFDPEPIRDEIVKVFRSIRGYKLEEIPLYVIRGQYTEGKKDGLRIPGYREEKYVAADSRTETYVAMKVMIDNWRWGGVPFYLTTGKRLATKRSDIRIHFRTTPIHLFSGQCTGLSCNKLVLGIQPNENIALKFGLKIPGAGFEVKQVSMDFNYSSLQRGPLPSAYERLLLDAMTGDSTLYSRRDALEESWKFVDPILEAWREHPEIRLYNYPAMSGGPLERYSLITAGVVDGGAPPIVTQKKGPVAEKSESQEEKK